MRLLSKQAIIDALSPAILLPGMVSFTRLTKKSWAYDQGKYKATVLERRDHDFRVPVWYEKSGSKVTLHCIKVGSLDADEKAAYTEACQKWETLRRMDPFRPKEGESSAPARAADSLHRLPDWLK